MDAGLSILPLQGFQTIQFQSSSPTTSSLRAIIELQSNMLRLVNIQVIKFEHKSEIILDQNSIHYFNHLNLKHQSIFLQQQLINDIYLAIMLTQYSFRFSQNLYFCHYQYLYFTSLYIISIIICTNITAMNTTKQMPDFDHIQNGVTWLGGPTNQLQKQHIPGYAGHVHGLHAENVYGRNFARVTAECLNSRHSKGINIDNDQKYRTTYKQEYEQPDSRRSKFITTAESVLGKLEEKQKIINQSIQQQYQRQPKSINEIPPIDRLPIPGYMGHKAVFRPPIKTVQPPSEPLPIELQQRKLVYTMLKTGSFDKKAIQNITKQEPVVGYSGFLKGVKAQNHYGQSYKDLAQRSIQN